MDFLNRPKSTLRLGGMLVAASLIMALISQYGFELWPCDLCIIQRYPAAVAVAIAIMAEFLGRPRFMLALFMLACLVTADIALYHTGVEQGWWPGPTSCSGDGLSGAVLSLEELKSEIMGAPLIRCDKPAIEIMGITMASANVLFSGLLFMMAFMGLMKSRNGVENVEING
ncbi:MAG: disulfide bond formation protein B [Rickettsiales bacterium]|nr:disulfide bond formation protein B [Rickettsiales bacterium]